MCKTTKVKSRRLHSQNRIILIVLTIGETPSGAGYSLYRIFCIMNLKRIQYVLFKNVVRFSVCGIFTRYWF